MRHWKNRGKRGRDLPMDSTDKLTLGRMLKVLIFPFTERRRLVHILNKCKSRQIIWLHSRKEVRDFLKEQEKTAQCNPSEVEEFLKEQIQREGKPEKPSDRRISRKSLALLKS